MIDDFDIGKINIGHSDMKFDEPQSAIAAPSPVLVNRERSGSLFQIDEEKN